VKTTVLSNGVGGWVDEPLVKTMEKYQVADDLPKAQKHGGFTVVIRGGMGNSSAVFEALTRDEMLKANFAYREISFMRCDIVTRETGYLAKQVLLFDMKGSRLSDMMDRRQSGIHKEVSSSSAYLYPQVRPHARRGGRGGVRGLQLCTHCTAAVNSDTCTVCALQLIWVKCSPRRGTIFLTRLG
jgi:hypothetical protein